MDLSDRARGALVGMAVGDALGAPVEFDGPEAIAGRREELFTLPGGGPFDWAPGEFTDDTQMAIVLARRLIADGGEVRQEELAADFAGWATHPATADVGMQTRTALTLMRSGTPWRTAVASLDAEAAGNGSLMRVAPVALAASSAEEAMALARAQSEVTHPHRWCVDACAVFAAVLWDALHGRPVDLSAAAERAAEPEVRAAVTAASDPPSMSGFVLHTLTGALWAVAGSDSFVDAVWRAVALGHDADTVGAVAGALAGATWGEAAIPPDLCERITTGHPLFAGSYPEELRLLADRLLTLHR